MADDPLKQAAGTAGDFERRAGEPQAGLLAEFVMFLRYNKKWWLVPILLVLALLGALVFLSSTTALPWIYTVF